MAEKFDEFLEEVENDIRQEKLLNLWRQYGKMVMGGIAGILIVIIAYNFWSHYDHNKRIQMAEKLISAQELIGQGEAEKAMTILNSLSTESHKTYQPLTQFQKAGLLLQEGTPTKTTQAIAIYHQLAGSTKIEPLWRDLATLLAVMASMDQPDIKVDDLLGQLNALTSDENPWRYFAKEIKGVLLYRKGEKSQAAELFARLVQDNQTPTGISMRARLMVQIVSTGTTD